MSAKAIREYDGKLLLAYHLLRAPLVSQQESPSLFAPAATKLAHIQVDTSLLNNKSAFDAALKQQLDTLEQTHPWLLTDKLVAKPDQLIKRRGKHGLLTLNKDWSEARQWIEERAGKEIQVYNFFLVGCLLGKIIKRVGKNGSGIVFGISRAYRI